MEIFGNTIHYENFFLEMLIEMNRSSSREACRLVKMLDQKAILYDYGGVEEERPILIIFYVLFFHQGYTGKWFSKK